MSYEREDYLGESRKPAGIGNMKRITATEKENRQIISTSNEGPPPNVDQYDFCIIVAHDPDTGDVPQKSFETIEKILIAFGRKYVYQYTSYNQAFHIVLIRASVSLMKTKADSLRLAMYLDDEIVKEEASRGDADCKIQPFEIPHRPEYSRFEPYTFNYGRYRMEERFQPLYWRSRGMNHPFSKDIRVQILKIIFDSEEKDGGVGTTLDTLKKMEVISDYFPLHSMRDLKRLEKKWISCRLGSTDLPIHEVKSYFGAKITYYFSFIDHIGAWLSLPAVVGIAFEAVAIYFSEYKYSPLILAFSLFIVLWAILVLCYWKRRECFLAMKWGLSTPGFHDTSTSTTSTSSNKAIPSTDQEIRFEYDGLEEVSHITGQYERLEAPDRIPLWLPVTLNIVILIVASCLASVIAIYVTKVQLLAATSYPDKQVQWIVSSITGIQVLLFNEAYYHVAVFLTRLENYYTNGDNERALIVKAFVLQFVNSYSSLFYIAFAALYISDSVPARDMSFLSICTKDTCMNILVMNLVAVCGTRALLKPTVMYLIPCTYRYLQRIYQNTVIPFDAIADNLNSCCCQCLWIFNCMNYGIPCSPRDPNRPQLDGQKGPDMWLWNLYHGNDEFGEEGKDDSQMSIGGVDSTVSVDAYQAEIEADRKHFDSVNDLNHIILDVVISFGYLVIFGCILPILAFTLLLELRYNYQCHAWRLIAIFQRPFNDDRIQYFTAWSHILHALVTVAIMTNAGLICFTIGIFEAWKLNHKLWLFIGIQIVMAGFRYFLPCVISDVPQEVIIQLKRSEFVAKKLIEKRPDEDFDPANLL